MKAFGPYLLLEKMGEGGAGVVHLAMRRNDSRLLVVKRLHERFAGEPEVASRFRHEAAVAVSVDSPHVVRVEDVGAVGDEPFIAMERVPGCTVAHLLVLLRGGKTELPVSTVLALLSDGLRGLEALHAATHPTTHEPLSVVHRDVSPRNLMVTPDPRLVLIDLGLGKSNLRDWATRTGTLMGTPGYIAPEQVAAAKVDHRADLYSLAVVGFELLTLSHYLPRGEAVQMFEACLRGPYRPPSTLRSSVPPAVDRFFERALSLQPDDRFASAAEMLAELSSLGPLGRPDPRAFPETFHREIAESEARMKSLRLQGDPPPEEPTEIYASRSEGLTRTKSLPATRPWPIRSAVVLSTIAVGIGIGVGYRLSTEETVLIAPVPASAIEAAPQVSVTPKPEVELRPEIEIERPAVPRPKKTIAREEPATPPPKAPEPDFDALVKDASSLRARRPVLAPDLDALITDATMWKRAEPSEQSRAAWVRLSAKLDELEASR